MEKMQHRISEALQQKNGGNQSEMARFIDVSPQAVQKWLAGGSEPRGKNLTKAAEFLGVSEAYLKFGIDQEQPLRLAARQERTEHRRSTDIDSSFTNENNVKALHPDDPLSDQEVSIKQSKVYFSAGPGREAIYEIIEDSEPATYQLSWFQKHRINPAKVRRFKVVGDSNEPMIYDGDTVLVNLAETNIVDGKLYAIRYGNDLRLKFLSRRLDGTLVLRSKNPDYKDEEIPPEMAEEHITVIGRVRDKSGSGGL